MNGLFQNITHALGWSIVHSLWQGILIYGILCTVYMVLPKMSSRNKYALAVSSQLLIFLAFAATLIHYLDFTFRATTPVAELGDSVALFIQNDANSFLNRLEPLFPWFSSIYVVGLFVQLIIFTNSFAKLHYLKTRGLDEVPVVWQDTFASLCGKLKLQQSIRLYLSEKVDVPLTLGHLKPIILFPIAYANNLDLKQVESILIHELAHIKRHDYLFNLLKVFVETAMFFNPFVWLLSKHIETEREHACDDIVVEWVPSPIAYAQALMSVELLRGTASPNYTMAATGNHKNHLLHRIQRITKMEKNYINVKQHLFALLLSVIALGTIAWIAPQESKSNQDPSQLLVSNHHTNKGVLSEQEALSAESARDTVKGSLKTNEQSVDSSRTRVSDPDGMHHPETKDWDKNTTALQDRQPSPLSKEQIVLIEANAKRIEDYYNSTEWKSHIAKIEENAKRVEDYYNSPEWKQHIAKIEENAKRVEDYYKSAEWKQHIAKIEENAKRVEDYYKSPAWKQHIAKIEEHTKKIEAQYNSPEWKAKIAEVVKNSKKLEDYYNSPEWKAQIAKIEETAQKHTAYYNSPEWKEKIQKIEENAKKLTEYYNSPEWKERNEKHLKFEEPATPKELSK
ncbi:M56 family metallopeptidase [Sphingobacterium paludis]|uniref:Beta-lactamase regulating signal transducer with metallopeptidase domain n=1 Tax=Sphingobacterium paludis TaxID=1476465 RepID=A0A4R7D2H5_9SPHI|nr:M56 family metallopeptidase [Sphingobacterium paludis]TDS14980.1 beta-lactamase regulating signal transducer with metallopeptidase domain [Sphingobacterium paludis]